jgi:hypothetical protein
MTGSLGLLQGEFLALVGANGRLSVWELATRKCVHQKTVAEAQKPSGPSLVREKLTLRLSVLPLTSVTPVLQALRASWSHDGSRLAVPGQRTVTILERGSWQPIAQSDSHGQQADVIRFADPADHSVRLGRADKALCTVSLAGHQMERSSPARMLAATSSFGMQRVWKLSSGTRLTTSCITWSSLPRGPSPSSTRRATSGFTSIAVRAGREWRVACCCLSPCMTAGDGASSAHKPVTPPAPAPE